MATRIRLPAIGWDRPLEVETLADPPPPEGRQVVVRVEACGVCHRDLIDRAGGFAFMRIPVTPGHEAVGRVVAVGPEVTAWRVGDRVASMHRDSCGACPSCLAGQTSLCAGAAFVLGLLADGGYATHLQAPESAFYRVPDELPAEQAAVLHCTFGTAYRGLRAAGTRPGDTVLVTGANGGVGMAGVQIARRLGAEVIAVVRHERFTAVLTALGARVVVDSGSGFHKQVPPVAVALDCVGQPTFNSSLRSLGLGGRLVVIGNVTPEKVSLNLGLVIVKALHLIGSSGANPTDMAGVLALHAAEPLALPAERVPLADAEAAQRRVRAGGLDGRLVLDCR